MKYYEHLNKDDLKKVLSSNGSDGKIQRNFGFSDLVQAYKGEN